MFKGNIEEFVAEKEYEKRRSIDIAIKKFLVGKETKGSWSTNIANGDDEEVTKKNSLARYIWREKMVMLSRKEMLNSIKNLAGQMDFCRQINCLECDMIFSGDEEENGYDNAARI